MMRIRIGVDARPLSWPQARGVQRVVKNLVREMVMQYAGEVELVLYADLPLQESVPGAVVRILPGGTLRYWSRLARAVGRDRCDAFLGTGPAVVVRAIPTVLIMYDDMPRWEVVCRRSGWRLGYRLVSARLARQAKLVAALSSDGLIFNSYAVRHDIYAASSRLRSKQSSVVYWGADPKLGKVDREWARAYVADRLGIRGEYLLYVGAVTRFKNIDGLMSAYRIVRKRHDHISLVVIGAQDWPLYGGEFPEINENVRYFDWLPDDAVAACYAACEALVTLSWYEGFGLPVLEAMCQGAPVVVSNRGALAEIAGQAGLVVDPEDIGHVANTISDLLDDPIARRMARDRSLRRAGDFGWGQAAAGVLSFVRTVIASGSTER